MAGYREHISVSGVLGVFYGVGSVLVFEFSPVQGALAGVLTWVAGMLLANVGADAALYLLSATYSVAFAVLYFGKPSTKAPRGNGKKVIRDLAEGFSYLRRTPSVAWLVSLGATIPMGGVFFSMMPVNIG